MIFFKKLIIIITFIFFFIHSLFACFSKHEVDTGQYFIARKWLDPNFNDQINKVAACLDKLPSEIYERLPSYEKSYIKNVYNVISKNFDEIDKKNYALRKFEDCIKIVAEQKAKEVFCPINVLDMRQTNFVEKYAILEFNECLRQKNVPYIRALEFKLPNVGFGRAISVSSSQSK
ncbi:hypothetical protein GVAV_001729 [Gurleya vavrai]